MLESQQALVSWWALWKGRSREPYASNSQQRISQHSRYGKNFSGKKVSELHSKLPIFIETKKVFEKNTEMHPILNSIVSGFICAIPVSIAVLPLDFVKIRSQGLSTMTTRKIIQQTRRTEGHFAFWKGFTAFTLRNPLPLIMVDVFSHMYLQKRLNWKENFELKSTSRKSQNQN